MARRAPGATGGLPASASKTSHEHWQTSCQWDLALSRSLQAADQIEHGSTVGRDADRYNRRRDASRKSETGDS